MMSDNKIIGIDGGKKQKIEGFRFDFHMMDGSVESYEGIVLATNAALDGFIQVVPLSEEDETLTLVAVHQIKKIESTELL